MDSILVVKIGGGEGVNAQQISADIAQLAAERPVVVVHGVSARMNQLCHQLDVPVRTLQSPSGHTSRYTDPQTRDVFVQAARSVNNDIASYLQQYGARPHSLADNGQVVVNGERKAALRAMVEGRIRIVRDDYSGSITTINTAPILAALERGEVPVIPPMAASDDGFLNVDGDRAGAEIAAALGAAEYVILSNVRGLYRDFPNEESLAHDVPSSRIDQAMNWAEGRMKRKVLGAQEAITGGVAQVRISDGRVDDPVTQALNGSGTTFINERILETSTVASH